MWKLFKFKFQRPHTSCTGTVALFSSHIVYGCFCTTVVEWLQQKPHGLHCLKHLPLALYRKSSSTPDLDSNLNMPPRQTTKLVLSFVKWE